MRSCKSGVTGSTESFSKVSTSECAKLCRPYPCLTMESRSTSFSTRRTASGECSRWSRNEIDVIFPERVIGIDEQSLGAVLFKHLFMITAPGGFTTLINLCRYEEPQH